VELVMLSENDWDLIRNQRGWRLPDSGLSPMSLATLFGAGAIALTLLLVPMLDGEGSPELAAYPAQVDRISTGSVRYGGSYTIRRSILQASPDSVCVIRDNGSRSGDC
jgi:hypothetical protein